ncbi:histidine kinase [Rhodococcus sp. NPDC003318]|uniref:sensor histidine kinase n=1 Tax=Rhodococcus sp. NPDC003318 TaxID=3364503 RepID=UPI00369AB38E
MRERLEGSVGTGAPVPAAALAVTAWLLSVLSVVLFLAADPPLDANQLFFLVDVVGSAVYGTVAGVVLARRVHPVPIILGVGAIGIGLAAFSYAYTQLAVLRPGLPAVAVIEPLQNTAWIPGTLALFLVVPWLIRDQRLDAVARLGLAAGVAATVWFFVARTWTDTATVWLVAPVAGMGLITAADVWRRHRTGPVDERVGLGWLAVGTALMALSFVPLALPASWPWLWMINPLVHLAVQAFYPAAMLVSVLRQRMWGIDLAVSRAVLAGTLTVGLIALYVLVATSLTSLLPTSDSVVAQAVAAGTVAVAVMPVRSWLQRRVRDLVYGAGADPARAFRDLGNRFASAQAPDELLAELATGVAVALRLESVAVWRVGEPEPVVRYGDPIVEESVVELVHRGAQVGRLAATAPPGESLDMRARKSLSELGSVVATGLVLVQASRDLDAARERLSTVRLEERRVIRRELHDGLGPSLAGIRLGLQGVRNLLAVDPDAAARLLDSLQQQLDHQIDGVRSLSRTLFPPILDELGLAAALHDLAAQHARAGFTLDVHAQVPSTLDATASAAAYGIAVEAVSNARRHSGADGCRVEVVCAAPDSAHDRPAASGAAELTVVVLDTGSGIDPGRVGGVGTRSMRERADAVGGTLVIDSPPPGGTRVTARLPLSAP